MSHSAILMIPARLQSTRLPGKILADIGGKPMVVRVMDRANAANLGPVVVAAAEQEIIDAVSAAGGRAIKTRPDHPSGSDRIMEALAVVDPDGAHEIVINVQGDLPLLDPAMLTEVVRPFSDPSVDISTLCAPITELRERDSPNVVKVVAAWRAGGIGRALYFTRATAPAGEGDLFHHIGLYAYRRAALARFVSLPPSPLEIREKLEQLRALENDMHIAVVATPHAPLGVDTQEDLDLVRARLDAA